jgi:hypothetical protein
LPPHPPACSFTPRALTPRRSAASANPFALTPRSASSISMLSPRPLKLSPLRPRATSASPRSISFAYGEADHVRDGGGTGGTASHRRGRLGGVDEGGSSAGSPVAASASPLQPPKDLPPIAAPPVPPLELGAAALAPAQPAAAPAQHPTTASAPQDQQQKVRLPSITDV